MAGIYVAHAEGRVSSPTHESPDSLQSGNRGNNNDDRPCRHHSGQRETLTILAYR